LPKLLRDLVAAKKIYIHKRRCDKKQPLDAYSGLPCNEDVPGQVLGLVPAEGIGRKELIELAKAKFGYVPNEVEDAIGKLKVDSQIREERAKKTS
jgi:hypothetical protein